MTTRRTPKSSAVREPTEMEIQHAAYLLWVENGRPEGCDLQHWLTAKEMPCLRSGRDFKTGHPDAERTRAATAPAYKKERRRTS